MKDFSSISFYTDTLNLRAFKVEDITQDYVDWLNDEQTNRFLSIDSIQTKESCKSYVESIRGRRDSALIGIFDKENELHIGNISVSMIDFPNQSAWVGVSVGRRGYLRQGLALEALSGAIKYFMCEYGIHSVNAGISVNNLSSIGLFLKCGFKIVGLLRESGVVDGKYEDGYILSVLESDLN